MIITLPLAPAAFFIPGCGWRATPFGLLTGVAASDERLRGFKERKTRPFLPHAPSPCPQEEEAVLANLFPPQIRSKAVIFQVPPSCRSPR
jgi:hypothetical protein